MSNYHTPRIYNVSGGTANQVTSYTVILDTPTVGDRTITDSNGISFVIPAPIVEMLQDADGDTNINAIEGGGANGGDRLEFIVDNVTVGSVEVLAGGITKWNFDGIVDPIVFAATPITTLVRDALPNITAGYNIFNTDTNTYQYYNGTVWTEYGTITELATNISPVADNSTGFLGTSTRVAREDHKHPVQISTNTPVDVTNFEASGSENSLGINNTDDTVQKVLDKIENFVSSPGELRSVVQGTLSTILIQTGLDGVNLANFLLSETGKNKGIVRINDGTGTLSQVQVVIPGLTSISITAIGGGSESIFTTGTDIIPQGLYEIQMASAANMVLQRLSPESSNTGIAAEDQNFDNNITRSMFMDESQIDIYDGDSVTPGDLKARITGKGEISGTAVRTKVETETVVTAQNIVLGRPNALSTGTNRRVTIDGSSTGTTNITFLGGGGFGEGEYAHIKIINSDGIARNVQFDNSQFFKLDGITTVGTITIPAGEERTYEFLGFNNQTARWVDEFSTSDVTATILDSSAGVDAQTLVNATGTGSVIFFVNGDTQVNDATLAPASGESLNGVVDGVFNFSNYPDNTQFIATDVANGEWVIAVEGANTQLDKPYARLELEYNSAITQGFTTPANMTISMGGSQVVPSLIPLTRVKHSQGGMVTNLSDSLSWLDANITNQSVSTNTGSSVIVPKTSKYIVRYNMPNVVDSSIDGGDNPLLVISINGTEQHYTPHAGELSLAGDLLLDLNAGDRVQMGFVVFNLDNVEGVEIAPTIDENDANLPNTNNIVYAVLEVEEFVKEEVVLAGMVTPENLPVYLFSWDAPNTSILAGSIGYVQIENATVKKDFGGLATYNGSNSEWTFTSGDNPIKVTSSILTFGSGNTSQISLYWSVPANPTLSIQSQNAEVTAINGFVGQGVNVEPSVLTIPANSTVTARLTHGVSSNSQIVQTKSFIAVEEITPTQKTVVMPEALEVEDNEVLLASGVGDGTADVGQALNTLANDYKYVKFSIYEDIGTLFNFHAESTEIEAEFLNQVLTTGEVDIRLGLDGLSSGAYVGFTSSDLSTSTFTVAQTSSIFSTYNWKIIGVKAQKTVINITDTPVYNTSNTPETEYNIEGNWLGNQRYTQTVFWTGSPSSPLALDSTIDPTKVIKIEGIGIAGGGSAWPLNTTASSTAGNATRVNSAGTGIDITEYGGFDSSGGGHVIVHYYR